MDRFVGLMQEREILLLEKQILIIVTEIPFLHSGLKQMGT